MARRRRFTASDLAGSPGPTVALQEAMRELAAIEAGPIVRRPLVEAWAPCVPVPLARPRWDSVRRRTYTSASSERGARAQAAALMGQGPREPTEGALRLLLDYTLPIPASWSKAGKQRAASGEWPHKSKPDLDNLCKLTMDVLSRLNWWKDDAQVCELVASKRYGSEPGVLVRLEAA